MAFDLLTLLALAALPQEPAGPFLAGAVEHGGRSYPYRLLPPAELEPGRRYPLVLFLHGAGERGEDNLLQLRHFPERMATPEQRDRFPVFLLAPQCPEGTDWADGGRGLALGGPLAPAPRPALEAALLALEEVVREHPVDLDRIHLTGLSMGGAGTWDLAARRPDSFASAAAICGGGDLHQAHRLIGLPLQAWHGGADTLVPPGATREMVRALRAAGGEVDWHELEGVGHASWVAAYAPEALPTWMLSRRRDPERTLARTLDRLAAVLGESGPLAVVASGEGAGGAAELLLAGLAARRPGVARVVRDASGAAAAGARLVLVAPPITESEVVELPEIVGDLRGAGIAVRLATPVHGEELEARRARVLALAEEVGVPVVDLGAAVAAHRRLFGPRPAERPGEGEARAAVEARRLEVLELARAALGALTRD